MRQIAKLFRLARFRTPAKRERDSIQPTTGRFDDLASDRLWQPLGEIGWAHPVQCAKEPPDPQLKWQRNAFPRQMAQITRRDVRPRMGRRLSSPDELSSMTGRFVLRSTVHAVPVLLHVEQTFAFPSGLPEEPPELNPLFTKMSHPGSMTNMRKNQFCTGFDM
jgi:hypothetical protein